MFSCESDLFELEENQREFQDICSTLKNHAFPSPWKMFFRNSNDSSFISEVSEFEVDSNNATIHSCPVIQLHADTVALGFQTDASEKELISCKIPIDKKKVYRLKESLMKAQDDATVESIKDFDIFLTISSLEVPALLELLDVSILSDAALSLILNAILHFKDQISIGTATALVHHVIYPLIFENKKNRYQNLSTTILKFAEMYPKAVIDEILIPYSKIETPDDLQSEIITKISKNNLPNEYISYSIKSVAENALPFENSFALLQCLIERKVHHDSVLYDLLLKRLHSWTSTCNKNAKFTKLLTSILSVYGNQLNEEQILLCDEVVKTNKTIIKKAAENILKRLKQENV